MKNRIIYFATLKLRFSTNYQGLSQSHVAGQSCFVDLYGLIISRILSFNPTQHARPHNDFNAFSLKQSNMYIMIML